MDYIPTKIGRVPDIYKESERIRKEDGKCRGGSQTKLSPHSFLEEKEKLKMFWKGKPSETWVVPPQGKANCAHKSQA